jgi:hypothetical protein
MPDLDLSDGVKRLFQHLLNDLVASQESDEDGREEGNQGEKEKPPQEAPAQEGPQWTLTPPPLILPHRIFTRHVHLGWVAGDI